MINHPDPQTTTSAQLHDTVNPAVADLPGASTTTDTSHAESQYTTDVDLPGHQIEKRIDVSGKRNLGRAQRRSWIVTGLFFLSGLLEMTLTLRFLFSILWEQARVAALRASRPTSVPCVLPP